MCSRLQPVKVRRMDRSDAHYAELIAQKQRLQQLESEYALKIQKLKEAQALRQAEPQPSLHDLTQDKLALGEDAEAEEDEQIPATLTPGHRRRSFRESGSFTKPKLCHLETAVAATVKQARASSGGGLPELLLGLNVEDLRLRYQLCAGLPELLQEETLPLPTAALAKVRPVLWSSSVSNRFLLCSFSVSCRSCRQTLIRWQLLKAGPSQNKNPLDRITALY